MTFHFGSAKEGRLINDNQPDNGDRKCVIDFSDEPGFSSVATVKKYFLLQTYIGDILLAVNPYKTLNLYSAEV